MTELAHVLVPFLYGSVPTTVSLGYLLGYCDLWFHVRHVRRYHPVEDREMTYWEKFRERQQRVVWHRVVLVPFIFGVIVLVAYTVVRWTVLLVL